MSLNQMVECHLSDPEASHVSELKSWFNDAEELRLWGGPNLRYDVSVEEFAHQINLKGLCSYCLITEQGRLAGFGQYYVRLNRHHFGRIAISPGFRGHGLVLTLLKLLHEKAPHDQQAQGYSLFVLENNEVAKRNYLKCGFEQQTYHGEMPWGMTDCIYMTAESLTF